MQEVIKDLEKILGEQISVYSDMENRIEQKKDILVKGDIEGLKSIDIEIEKLVKSIKRLENQRIHSLAKHPGLISKPLSHIAELTESGDDKAKILSLKDKLSGLLSRIKKGNDLNAELLAHSIRLVQHTATLIGNALIPEGSAYNRNGKVYKSNSQSSSISSVVHDV